MNVQSVNQPLATVEADWLVLGIFEEEMDPPRSVRETPLGDLLVRLLAAKDVSGDLGETTPIFGLVGVAAPSILVVGLGERAHFGSGPAFDMGVAVGKRLGGMPRETVAIGLPEAGDPREIAESLTSGVIVGTHGPGLRKSEPTRHPFGKLIVVATTDPGIVGDALNEALQRGEVVGEAINLARHLANLPPAEKAPAQLAARAQAVAAASGIEAAVWDVAKIREERFEGLLGVSAGSDQPPAFVVLNYRRGGEAPTLALVGKGVTFDSGGLSIKSTSSMKDMKSDMTGSAIVLATMQAVARLQLPVNLVGYLVMTENMTGGRALKLGDVLKMRNGKTVEVLDTDAEGRLILADALSFAVESGPARVLDLATLTGSCVVALGTEVAGLFSNDDEFARAVEAASRRTGERVWRLPLDDDYEDLLKSEVADLKNVGGRWGGAITAAKFLEQFIGETPWVHLDIAGPSWADTGCATQDSGGTGCFVRTLVALIEAQTRGAQVP